MLWAAWSLHAYCEVVLRQTRSLDVRACIMDVYVNDIWVKRLPDDSEPNEKDISRFMRPGENHVKIFAREKREDALLGKRAGFSLLLEERSHGAIKELARYSCPSQFLVPVVHDYIVNHAPLSPH